MWGSVGIITGGNVVINDATFQYGGGAINTQEFTIDSQSVLAFLSDVTAPTFPVIFNTYSDADGTHAYITNNNFFHNFDAAMQIEPDGLLGGDPLTPLESGHPFFRGNVMTGNGIDGLSVVTDRVYEDNRPPTGITSARSRRPAASPALQSGRQHGLGLHRPDLCARGDHRPRAGRPTASAPRSMVSVPVSRPQHRHLGGGTRPDRHPDDPGGTAGDHARRRRDDPQPRPVGDRQDAQRLSPRSDSTSLGTPAASTQLDENAGAGIIAGVDNGVDPGASDPLIDPGAYSEVRILGIPGNQTTGQQRVPVIITSLRDGTVGTTVRGVNMYNIAREPPGLHRLHQCGRHR